MNGTVQWSIAYALLSPIGSRAAVWPLLHRGTLLWRDDDPWAVHADLGGVTWNFGWELLRGGLDQPAGLGDVRITPLGYMPGGHRHQIELCSPDGHAVLQVRTAALRHFAAAVHQQWAEWPITDRELADWLAEETR